MRNSGTRISDTPRPELIGRVAGFFALGKYIDMFAFSRQSPPKFSPIALFRPPHPRPRCPAPTSGPIRRSGTAERTLVNDFTSRYGGREGGGAGRSAALLHNNLQRALPRRATRDRPPFFRRRPFARTRETTRAIESHQHDGFVRGILPFPVSPPTSCPSRSARNNLSDQLQLLLYSASTLQTFYAALS